MMKTFISFLCVLGMTSLLFAPPIPEGDQCSNAIPIPSLPYCAEGSTIGYSSYYETCSQPLAGLDVVYSYTPAVNMTVSLSTCGSEWETILFIHTGCAAGYGDPICATSGNCPGELGVCYTGLALEASTTYYFVVDHNDNYPGGDYRLAIQEGSECPDCDEILPVELMSFTATGQNRQVTLNWSTASEHNIDRFEMVRNGIVRDEIEAAGEGSSTRNYTWIDQDVQNGLTYEYTLVSVDFDGTRETLGTVSATPSFDAYAVTEYALHQNYPNPFNPTTTITVDLAEAGFASLRVFNLVGQEVRTLISESLPRGSHMALFDAASLPSGVYVYQLDVNDFSAQRKMILMK